MSPFWMVALVACGPHKLVARVAPAPASHGFLFSAVNVFDGEQALGPRDVLVRDGLVVSVGEPGTLQPGPQDERIDGTGRTLLPGLIDSHAHLESSGEAMWDLGLPDLEDIAEAYLYAGVTTIVVMQGGKAQFALASSARDGEIEAPRLYLSGPRITAPDGFPINLFRELVPWPFRGMVINPVMRTAADPDEARAEVNTIVDTYAPDFMKLTCDALPPGTPKLGPDVLVAAIEQSRARGVRSTAHIGAPEDVMVAAEAGLDLFAHPPSGARFTEAQIARLAELGTPFVSTFRFLSASDELAKDHGTPLERETVHADTLAAFGERPEKFTFPAVPPDLDVAATLAGLMDNVRQNAVALHEAGVPLFAGTDAGSPGVFPGTSLHRELAALVAAGLSPTEALAAATGAPAAFLDPTHGYGRVAPGQVADLLLVTGDPTVDISATAAIVDVFQAGHRLVRSHGE